MTATKAKGKSSVIKKDSDLEVTLYAPGSYPSHRVTSYDPVTGKRETRSGTRHLDAAEQKFDEISDYVRTTRALIAVGGAESATEPRQRSAPEAALAAPSHAHARTAAAASAQRPALVETGRGSAEPTAQGSTVTVPVISGCSAQ